MRKEKKDSMENEKEKQDNRINIERKPKEKTEDIKEPGTDTAETAEEQLKEADEKEQKINELSERNQQLQNEVTELKDRLLRRAAEFDNYKRRTEAEQLNLLKYAAENFILKVLPVYDDFERSLNHIKETDNIDSIKEGLQMVLTKFQKILDEQGVKKIESLGKPFDVNYHEALMQQTVNNAAPHTVIHEVESGYVYKDKVIRHAKVIVSDDNSTPAKKENSDQKEK